MKIIADLFPVILFFIAYKLFDIYVATQVAIAAAALQLLWSKVVHGRIEKMHWITLALLILFGGLTLALRDPTFIKWKPTVVNWLFGIAFLGSGLLMERGLLRRMMEHAVSLPDPVWRRLNMVWINFFFLMGALNLYVAYNYSEETWVNFKLFGFMGLTLLFLLGQGFYLARHIVDEKPAVEEK